MKLHYFAIGIAFAVTAHFVLSRGGPVDADADRLVVRQHPTDDKTVIFAWHGRVGWPMARRISESFELWKDKSDYIVIELDSPGGSVDEGERVIKIIKKMKRTHDIETYVGAGKNCLSMCVPIYIQGQSRVASASSRWMFHEPIATDVFTGQKTFTYEYEKRISSQDFYYRYFNRSEMNPEWREKLRRQWRYGDVWKTGRELKDERSNIITIIETQNNRDDYNLSSE